MGDPESTNSAPSQPKPSVEPAFLTKYPPGCRKSRDAAPVFMSCSAPTKRNNATKKRTTHQAILTARDPGSSGDAGRDGARVGSVSTGYS
jgi:hypothetical protein